MRSIIVLALLASSSLQVEAQTSAKPEIYALDSLSDHTARVGTSNIFVYQTKGGSLGQFLLGGALLNSRAMTRQSESIANSINSDSTVQEFGSIEQIVEEKAATNLIKEHAILLSVDSDGITRATSSCMRKTGQSVGSTISITSNPPCQIPSFKRTAELRSLRRFKRRRPQP
ncbi:hypothetical protein [Lysobacter rhizosphaerae]